MKRITFLTALDAVCLMTLKAQQWTGFSKTEPAAPELNILTYNIQTASFTPKSQTYHPDDKEGLRQFLRQPSDIAGQINGQLLGLQLSDTLNWQTQEEWVNKIENIYWNEDVPKRLVSIEDWSNTHLSGNLNCCQWTHLAFLRCSDNRLTQLDISNCISLKALYCVNNMLTVLDAGNSEKLSVLWCFSNRLTTLNVSNCLKLKGLYCSDNLLIDLDISNNTKLYELHCSFNQLTTLDVSNFTNLWSLYCEENRFLFSTLPIKPNEEMSKYTYSPQQIIDGGSTDYKTGIDLSTEYSIDGNITNFSWFDVTGENEQPLEPTGENGKFMLTKYFINKRLRYNNDQCRFSQS